MRIKIRYGERDIGVELGCGVVNKRKRQRRSSKEKELQISIDIESEENKLTRVVNMYLAAVLAGTISHSHK